MSASRVIKQLERRLEDLPASYSPAYAHSRTNSPAFREAVAKLSSLWGQPDKRLSTNPKHFSLVVLDFSDFTLAQTELVKLTRSVARLIKKRLRRQDVMGRFGPNKLIVGLTGADYHDAKRYIRTLRTRLIELLGEKGLASFEVKVGLAEMHPGMSAEQLFAAADAASSPSNGFNRVGSLILQNRLLVNIGRIGTRQSYRGLALALERLSDPLIALFQYLVNGLTWSLLKVFCRLEITGQPNLRHLTGPLIITANHKSHLDPQLVSLAVMSRPQLYPLRYMAKNELFYYPGLNLLMYLLGAFKAHKKTGIDKSLATPLRQLSRGGSVVMYPEGKIIPDRSQLGQGRRGAAILALLSDATILPVSLHTPRGFNLGVFLFKRASVRIKVGQPYKLDEADYIDFSDELLREATDYIMGKVGKLYFE